ncbi:hypothetical protein [Billgrantia endophytica]|uniref:hypothetical protein n=1 Tax=Billgrantia endophytica TaxID=2033802 RepID=UPI0013FD4591|nr:hypothetical protein [Halomonas endophytica]
MFTDPPLGEKFRRLAMLDKTVEQAQIEHLDLHAFGDQQVVLGSPTKVKQSMGYQR